MSVHETFFTLRNDRDMPAIGFGTWLIPEGDEAYGAVRAAIDIGYRHIDTAQAYDNERSVGRAVRDSGVRRNELFVTSKLPAEIKDADDAAASFEQTMEEIGLDYLDLYLIHAPWPWTDIGRDCVEGNRQVWALFEQLLASGQVRAIGVSNFNRSDLDLLSETAKIVPMVNQISFSIGRDQRDTIAACCEQDIALQGYSPLGHGGLVARPEIGDIAGRYGRTPAQLCNRYVLQNGLAPLPKTVSPKRMRENADIDFVIGDEDMAVLDGMAR